MPIPPDHPSSSHRDQQLLYWQQNAPAFKSLFHKNPLATIGQITYDSSCCVKAELLALLSSLNSIPSLPPPHITAIQHHLISVLKIEPDCAREVCGGRGVPVALGEAPTPPGVEATPAPAPPPPEVWRGVWLEVAERVGKKSWLIWAAVYAALSVTAHRNLHWFYYSSDVYGNSYVLVLSQTGSGKELVSHMVRDLSPAHVHIFSGLQSGPGLIPHLTGDSLEDKGRREVDGRPCILMASEWSRLVEMAGVEHATIVEDLNEIHWRRYSWDTSRSLKSTLGGSTLIKNPSLSICGTTTEGAFGKFITKKPDWVTSGFANRYLILRHSEPWEPYTGQSFSTEPLQGLLTPLESHAWGHGQRLSLAYSEPAWELFLQYQEDRLAPTRNSAQWGQAMGRIDSLYHHIALLYAWSEQEEKVLPEHTDAARAVVESYFDTFSTMLTDYEPEAPTAVKRMQLVEDKVKRILRERGEMSLRDIAKYTHIPTQEARTLLDALLQTGQAQEMHYRDRKVILYYLT